MHRNGGYERHPAWIENLRELGFRWVTFMPTYLVRDAVPLEIDTGAGASLGEIAEAVSAFVDAGFNVKFEPHLDYESTLTGGDYEWRRRMYFEPDGVYASQILAPLFGLASEAAGRGATVHFTLGSELDVALAEFPDRWDGLARVLRAEHPGIAVGHNINHDSLASSTDVRTPLNAEREKRGLAPLDWREHRLRLEAGFQYFRELDYVGFSFYPDVRSGRSERWWRAQTTDLQTRVVARSFQGEVQKLTSRLRRNAGERPQFVIGEAGIGCADPARPWHFEAKTLLGGEGAMDTGAAELRRKFYLGLLECLRKAPHLFGANPVTFWTVTHYDFVGALEHPGNEAFRDEVLRDAVRRYNSGR